MHRGSCLCGTVTYEAEWDDITDDLPQFAERATA
jgi:hypothetical protein